MKNYLRLYWNRFIHRNFHVIHPNLNKNTVIDTFNAYINGLGVYLYGNSDIRGEIIFVLAALDSMEED
jgi:hypothetical protein